MASLAFFTCFYACSLLGPLAPGLQQQLHLNEVELGWMVAIPVGMGSLMRVPMGVLTGRPRLERARPGPEVPMLPGNWPEGGTVTGVVGAAGSLSGFFPPIAARATGSNYICID